MEEFLAIRKEKLRAMFLSSFVPQKLRSKWEQARGMVQNMSAANCETCAYYTYDEDYEDYVCDINVDEDEYMRMMSDSHYSCPYYRNGDEYAVVRRQM